MAERYVMEGRIRRPFVRPDPGPTLETLAPYRTYRDNPPCLCDCGRITNADMFVFLDGAYVCDGCWTRERREGRLTEDRVRRANYQRVRHPEIVVRRSRR